MVNDVLLRNAFQFTPLREGRRGDGGHFRNRQDFNSRPSARGDVSAHSGFIGC